MRVLLRRKLCACGCGQIVAKGKRFRRGHNGRLVNNVEIERRRKISENLIVSRNTSKYKKYFSKKFKTLWKNKEFREKHKESMAIARANPEYREKASNRAKKMWDERTLEQRRIILKNTHTPEVYAKISGENSSSWKGGSSLIPYPKEWTKNFRKEIKYRDDFKCFLCKGEDKLCIHHVDYKKHNLNKNNLITLCRGCHLKTNTHRDYWEVNFNYIFKGNLEKNANIICQ